LISDVAQFQAKRLHGGAPAAPTATTPLKSPDAVAIPIYGSAAGTAETSPATTTAAAAAAASVDEDVLQERERVEAAVARLADSKAPPAVLVHGLTKVFSIKEEVHEVSTRPKSPGDVLRALLPGGRGPRTKTVHKHVLNGIDLAIPPNECFGLLGPNGAGKTTMLSVLTGEQAPTKGSAAIVGYDVVLQRMQAFEHVGFCPQFDALVDNMTPEEHLRLYAHIRGVPPHLIKDRYGSLS